MKHIDKVALSTADGFFIVGLDQILYCQANGAETNFILINGKTITSVFSLETYSETLNDQNFFKVANSFLINLKHIVRYLRGEGGWVLMTNGRRIEVERARKVSLLAILKK